MNFTKMEGTGNDYIYVNCLENEVENASKVSIQVSDRHFGIGGDGLVLILPSDRADFRMRIFNADGSEAEMCGNALRCVGKYCYEKRLTYKKNISLETLSGIKYLDLTIVNKVVQSVRVDMGCALWPDGRGKYSEITIGNDTFHGIRVSMGNPHYVIFVDEITDRLVLKKGKLIKQHPFFPEKTNVEFAQIIDKKNIRFRVWERGSGETLSCGTGACAVSAAAYVSGLTENSVSCVLAGGKLDLEIADNDKIFMTGPAEIVFEGTIKLKEINRKYLL